MAVYVDDIIITGSNTTEVGFVKSQLNSLFGIKYLGYLNYFLGLEVAYLSTGIFLSQKKFTLELLKQSGITDASVTATPLPLNCKLLPDEGTLMSDPTTYRTLIGKLNFLTHTRPDLSFTVQVLSQFMQAPRDTHFKALQHTLRYVQGTVGQGILLQGSDQLQIQAYSDESALCRLATFFNTLGRGNSLHSRLLVSLLPEGNPFFSCYREELELLT